MPRQPRENQEGVIFYHIMVQGINREYIFQNEVMIAKYLELMTKYSEELEVMEIPQNVMLKLQGEK